MRGSEGRFLLTSAVGCVHSRASGAAVDVSGGRGGGGGPVRRPRLLFQGAVLSTEAGVQGCVLP